MVRLLEVPKISVSLGIALSLSFISTLFAEDSSEALVYHGVKLTVVSSAEVNGELLKVSLGNQSFLVPKSKAAREVALRYLRDANLVENLDTSSLKQIARGAANDKDLEVLAALYKSALAVSGNTDFNSIDLWSALIADSLVAYDALADNLESPNSAVNLPNICAALSAANRASARSGGVKKLERLNQNIGADCLALTLRSLVETTLAGRDDSAEFVINSAQNDRADSVIALIRSIDNDIATGDALSFRNHLELLISLARSLGVTNLSSSALSQRFIDRALLSGKFAGAIRELVKIPFDERTPKTHKDLTLALKSLTSADRELLIDPEFRRVITLYAGKDSEISFEWEALKKRIVDSSIKEGEIDLAKDANVSWILPIALVSLLLGLAAIFIRMIKRRSNIADKSAPPVEYPAEYVEALKVFGLSPEATLEDIKKAYRMAVKKYHPDLKDQSNREDQLFFIRLNLEYEKLLKFHQRN